MFEGDARVAQALDDAFTRHGHSFRAVRHVALIALRDKGGWKSKTK